MDQPTGSVNVAGRVDQESRAWLERLGSAGPEREAAIGELHELLVRAASFEVNRRRTTFPHLRGGDLADLAQQSADDALLAILGKLDDFRGESRFTTWAVRAIRSCRKGAQALLAGPRDSDDRRGVAAGR